MMHENDTKQPLLSFREAFELYENGKHRRYELLFAVNGGAFAIVKLLNEKLLDKNSQPLGKLHLPQIAIGMILFTSVMVFDIFSFGLKWHGLAKDIDRRENCEIFGWKGQVVLVLIGLLLCASWALAAW